MLDGLPQDNISETLKTCTLNLRGSGRQKMCTSHGSPHSTLRVRPLLQIEGSLYPCWRVIHDSEQTTPGIPTSDTVVSGNGFADDLVLEEARGDDV